MTRTPWELSSEAVAARHGLRVRDVTRFDLNTSPFPPASWDAAMEAARQEGQPNEYFDTSYAELADLFSAYYGVGTDHLIVGAGADEILDITTKTFLDNGDRVVVSAPTYSMYPIVSEQMGATVRRVPLLADFAPDIDGILAAAAGAKIIWHCNPNSPTGNATDPAALERLIADAPCMVVVDEAYAEYIGWSAVPLVAQYPHLVVVRTMSKAFGMAGMRLACGIAAPEVIGDDEPRAPAEQRQPRHGAGRRGGLARSRRDARATSRRSSPRASLRGRALRVRRARLPLRDELPPDALGEPRRRAVRLRLAGGARHGRPQLLAAPPPAGHLRITVRTAAENARLLTALKEWRRQRER